MTSDLDSRLVDFVQTLISTMELTLDVKVERSHGITRIGLYGDEGQVFVQRKGLALDALQHIVGTAFRSELGDHRVVVDCLDFRAAQDAELCQQALFLGARAKSTGLPQEIGPLNPYARRIVHLAVAEDPELATESVGDAFLKTVVISTKFGG